MLVVTAKFTHIPNQKESFKKEIELLVAGTRKEEGCISFTLFTSCESEDEYMLFEEWENPESLEYHKTTEHYKQFGKINDQLISKKEVVIYNASKE